MRGNLKVFLLTISIVLFTNEFIHGEVINLSSTNGQIVVSGSQYSNNMNRVYMIDVGVDMTLSFDYTLTSSDPMDSVLFYDINHSDKETLIHSYFGGQCSESGFYTHSNSGKAKVVIKTNGTNSIADGGQESGFHINYNVSNFSINGNTNILGNLTVGTTSSNLLQLNGKIRGGETGGALKLLNDNGYLTMGASNTSPYKSFDFSSDKTFFKFLKPLHFQAIATQNGVNIATINTIGNFSFEKNVRIKGPLSLAGNSITPITNLNGNLNITRPATGGQFINLSRTGSSTQWSIGTVYNTGKFAIGQANTTDANFLTPPFVIETDGKVGIGTAQPLTDLDVRGVISAHEIRVTLDHSADFVFDEKYNLPTLNEVNSFIQENGHLPGIPKESKVVNEGLNVADMQIKLLQKVEELTLYAIEQQKRIEQLEKELNAFKNK